MTKIRTCKYCGTERIYAKGMCQFHYYKDLKQRTKYKKKRTPIKSVSKAMRSQRKLYSRVRKEFFSTGSNQLCKARVSGVCLIHATDIHHMAGRIGELLTNTNYFLPVCRACHMHIHSNHQWAEEQGFIVHVN